MEVADRSSLTILIMNLHTPASFMRDPTLRKGYTRCKSKKYGECVFYRCSERRSYQKWLEHHEKAHPNDKLLLVYDDCNECNKLRAEEIRFMKDRISKLNNKINRMNSLAEIAEMLRNPRSMMIGSRQMTRRFQSALDLLSRRPIPALGLRWSKSQYIKRQENFSANTYRFYIDFIIHKE